jgi:peptide deformylase
MREENVVTERPILPIDHPILRKTAKPVVRFGPSLRKLVDDMFATLNDADGVGLAAPQVGQSIRLLVVDYEEEHLALCNPVITGKTGESIGAEGCLSLPGFVGTRIKRAASVEVEAQDVHGASVRLSAEGMLARILQHEVDHLDGILFLDYLESPGDLCAIADEAESDLKTPVTAGSGT